MRILLSIKAVLNYLYNHLIDLVWTKKIRFADGTEIDSVDSLPKGNSLFDIKLLSQAIADKGWAFMCHTTRRDLPKTDVPTLYNDIKFKYDNADKQHITSEITGQNMLSVIYDKYTQKYYYKLYGSDYNKIFASDYPDLSNSQSVLTFTEHFAYVILCGQNINIVSSGIANEKLHIFNKNWEFIKTYNLREISNGDLRCWRSVENAFIFTCSKEDNSNADCYVIKIEDDITANLTHTNNLYSNTKPLPNRISDVINGKFYITIMRWGASVTIVEFDINDITNYTEYNMSDINVYPNWYKWNFSEIVFYNDYFYITVSNKIFKSQNLVNWTLVYTTTENNWRIIKKDNDYYIFGDGYIIITNNFANFSTLLTFTKSTNMGENTGNYCQVAENIIIISSNAYKFYLYSAPTIKVYTDSYTINGNTVSINYYKYNDFKICLSDNGGTNDTNLETVYNYLGYLNYWLLDLTNETVCVQRDKNTYSAMFIGDDFIDDLEDLPTNDYSSVVLKNQLLNIASALISADTINNLQDGTKDTVYQTSAPTLIIAGRTSNTSDWYLEIQLSSDGVNFITVARYGVSNGDPGSSAIIPIIVGSGVYWKVATSLSTGYIKYGAI